MNDIVIVGAGSRGAGIYSRYAAEHPQRFRVVAVAEPRPEMRQQVGERHQLAPEVCFEDWRQLLQQPQLAAAAVVATQDRDHCQPAVALMERGYDVLLEKPMAVELEECRLLQQSSRRYGRILLVAHVLRYTPYFRQLKQILDQGWLGQLITLRHLEPVLYWHQAHSFVRGNWRQAASSAPMILAKSCHDLDMLCHLVGCDPLAVASFGSLSHFRPENAPAGAGERCWDCPLAEGDCSYSAKSFYLGLARQGQWGWPVDVLTSELTFSGVERALRQGPYGRCVYRCDNDVVDHQVVALEFQGGITASFTMTAFADGRQRETELHGSEGQLSGDGQILRLRTFRPGTAPLGASPGRDAQEWIWDLSHWSQQSHQGGDAGLMDYFAWCLENRQQALALPLAEEALRGHELCFAAERARVEGQVIRLGKSIPIP